jgi:hypothetical protein
MPKYIAFLYRAHLIYGDTFELDGNRLLLQAKHFTNRQSLVFTEYVVYEINFETGNLLVVDSYTREPQ